MPTQDLVTLRMLPFDPRNGLVRPQYSILWPRNHQHGKFYTFLAGKQTDPLPRELAEVLLELRQKETADGEQLESSHRVFEVVGGMEHVSTAPTRPEAPPVAWPDPQSLAEEDALPVTARAAPEPEPAPAPTRVAPKPGKRK